MSSLLADGAAMKDSEDTRDGRPKGEYVRYITLSVIVMFHLHNSLAFTEHVFFVLEYINQFRSKENRKCTSCLLSQYVLY